MNLRTLAGVSALALIAASAPALAQRTPLVQDGKALPQHIAKFATQGRATDAGDINGDALGRGVSPFALTDHGASGLNVKSSDDAAHNELTLGHDSDGNAVLSIDSFGGMPTKELLIRKNGTNYTWPGSGLGNVSGPNSVFDHDIAYFNGPGGTTIAGTGGKLYANEFGLTVGYGAGATAEGPVQVQNRYTGSATTPTGLFGHLDYAPAGGGSFASNPDGIYGDLWYNAPGTYSGLGAAIRGNAYTIPQITAAIVTPGLGYNNGDIVAISGGTCTTLLNTPPSFKLTVSGGVVTGATYLPAGACTVYPTDPVSVTGGNGTGLTLNLSHSIINTKYLVGVYGRARHTAKGTIDDAIPLFADGCYNTGGGTINNCVDVWLQQPYDTNHQASYGIWANGAFSEGVIASAAFVDINLNPGVGGIVSSTSAIAAGIGQPCRANIQGGSNATFSSLGTDCYVTLNTQGAGQVTVQQAGKASASFAADPAAVNYLSISGTATTVGPLIQVQSSLDTDIDLRLRAMGAGMVRLQGGGTDLLKAGPIDGVGTTSLLLLVHNNGGISMQPVTLGPNDSGGTGSRALVVPN